MHKENSFSINLLAKKKLEKLLTKSPTSMEAELVRLRAKLEDEARREQKLELYLASLRQQLAAEKQELAQLSASYDGPIQELLALDCEANIEKYYKLQDQRRSLDEQVKSAEPLHKRYAETVEKELAQLRDQNQAMRDKIEEQKRIAAIQLRKLVEAKSSFSRIAESRPSETLASEEEYLPNSFVTSRASLKKRLSIRSRATKPALSSERHSNHVSDSNLYGLIFGARAK